MPSHRPDRYRGWAGTINVRFDRQRGQSAGV